MSVYRRYLSTVLIYVVIISAAFFVARSKQQPEQPATDTTQFSVNTDTSYVQTGPFFSLSTIRTFGTAENPRLWLNHRNIDSLDFRVYRINDPQRFFTQLGNPHQMGED